MSKQFTLSLEASKLGNKTKSKGNSSEFVCKCTTSKLFTRKKLGRGTRLKN